MELRPRAMNRAGDNAGIVLRSWSRGYPEILRKAAAILLTVAAAEIFGIFRRTTVPGEGHIDGTGENEK